ncbi:MAG: amidohydrolase family protein, partial [Pontibacterium sp.]
KKVMAWLGLDQCVLVQANAYRDDNRSLLKALGQLGDKARGIVVVTPETTEEEIAHMHEQGARGARIMNLPGGAVGVRETLNINAKVKNFGWHCIVQFDGTETLDYLPILEQIDNAFVLDHIGKFLSPTSLHSEQVKALQSLVDKGNCYIKIAGCYESSHTGAPLYQDTEALTRLFVNQAPERILWGSNWPHTSQPVEKAPNDAQLLDRVCSWFDTSDIIEKVFVDNPRKLYDFK